MAKTRPKPGAIDPITPLPETVQVNHREVYDYLIGKGIGDVHAKGILANMAADASFQPWVPSQMIDGAPMAFGFFQSQLQKKSEEFVAFLEGKSTGWNHIWQAPLEFTLEAKEGKAYLEKTFNSPEEATRWFTEKLEKSNTWLKKTETDGKTSYQPANATEVKGHEKDAAWLESNGYIRNAEYRVQEHLAPFLPFNPLKQAKRRKAADDPTDLKPYINKLDGLLAKLKPFIQTKT